MTKVLKTVTLAALAFASINASAQNGVNSPYSRAGFGLMADRSMGFNKGMGGIAQGYRNGQTINTANPAALSACDSLTALFDLGLSVYNGNYKMGTVQQNAKNASFDYFAFHFRAIKGVGVAVSLLPVTNIGYSFTSQSESLEGAQSVSSSYSFNGSGGLHQLALGAGWQIIKPLSLGVNVSYIFGDYNHSMNMPFNSASISSITRSYTADISTYSIDLGAQYTQNLSKDNKVTFGFTYTLGHDVDNDAYRSTMSSNSSSGIMKATTDTICNAFQLPSSFAAGVTFYNSDRFLVGADFELQKWSKVRFPNSASSENYTTATGLFNDRMKIAAGLAWTPNPLSSKYSKRMTYKLGGYYSKPYANVEGASGLSDKPFEFGASAGLSFPISNSHTNGSTPKIHLSFQWVHTNVPYISSVNSSQNKLTENYLKASLGITFSDRWFYKWKVK